jgi:hypothetical protein
MILATASLIGAAACGSSVVDVNHTTTTSSSSSTTSSGASSSSSSTGSSSTGSSSSSGQLCPGYSDQTGLGAITVRFVNQSPMPIYLPSMCDGIQYTIQDGAGGSGNGGYVYDTSCLQTCEALQTQPQYACGACAPTSYLIPAGATRDVSWNGTGLESESMPASCWKTPPSSTTCGRIYAAQSGTYLASAVGYIGCDGGCTCDANGVCSGAATGQSGYSSTTKFDFPNNGGPVQVVFGPCTFGCPAN